MSTTDRKTSARTRSTERQKKTFSAGVRDTSELLVVSASDDLNEDQPVRAVFSDTLPVTDQLAAIEAMALVYLNTVSNDKLDEEQLLAASRLIALIIEAVLQLPEGSIDRVVMQENYPALDHFITRITSETDCCCSCCGEPIEREPDVEYVPAPDFRGLQNDEAVSAKLRAAIQPENQEDENAGERLRDIVEHLLNDVDDQNDAVSQLARDLAENRKLRATISRYLVDWVAGQLLEEVSAHQVAVKAAEAA